MLDLESWYDQYRQDSEDIAAYWAGRVDNDVCGWAGTIRESWKHQTQPLLGGALLHGPAGSGRHNTAVQLAMDRAASFGHVAYFATGDDLWADCDSYAPVRERLERLLCWDEDEGAVLVLEQWENHPFTGKLLNQLGLLLCRFRQGMDENAECLPIFVVLIADGEPKVPALLREMVRSVRMTLPNADQREEFFSLQELAGEVEDYVDLRELAEASEGCNYSQLADLLQSLHDQQNSLSLSRKAAPADFARQQAGLDPKQQRQEALMQKLDAYLTAMPERLKALNKLGSLQLATQPAPAAVAAAPQPAEAADNAPRRYSGKELSEMRVRDMIAIGFDEDIADVLLNANAEA